ncbi:hypothetical protein ACQJBY_007834 [Aegilops geniculata]
MLPGFLSGARRRNHGATQENPNALQGPSAARLDPDATVVPRVQHICHRLVQTSLDRIKRESRLPSSHTLVDPPRSIDRGRPAGGVGGGDARRRPAAHGGAGRAAGWRWDREADMAEKDGPWLFFFVFSRMYQFVFLTYSGPGEHGLLVSIM